MFKHVATQANEERLWFESGGAQLYGTLHHALVPARGAVLLCPADGEERTWSHRAYVHLARKLASNAFTVLRFDHMGQGESTAVYEDTDVETRLGDIAAAAALLRQRERRTGLALLGLRLGASLAIEAAARDPRIERLVLWEPVFDLGAYTQHLLRVNLTMQMVIHRKVVRTGDQLLQDLSAGARVSANGYGLTHAFLNGLGRLRPSERLSDFRGAAVIMSTAPARVPKSGAEILSTQFAQFWKEPKADMTPPWALINDTVTWLDRQFSTDVS
jgi:alpha/beta superfamily hydrolase